MRQRRMEGAVVGDEILVVAGKAPELIERLRRLGIDTAGLGVEITTRKMYEASGRLIHTCVARWFCQSVKRLTL